MKFKRSVRQTYKDVKKCPFCWAMIDTDVEDCIACFFPQPRNRQEEIQASYQFSGMSDVYGINTTNEQGRN